MSIFKKENGTLVEYTNPIANNCIAPVEDGGTSAHAYAEGAFVMVRNILKKITSAVSIGDAIDNTNSQDTTVATELADIEGDIEQINSDLSDMKQHTLGSSISINSYSSASNKFTVPTDGYILAEAGSQQAYRTVIWCDTMPLIAVDTSKNASVFVREGMQVYCETNNSNAYFIPLT
jgi:hypothetical protein